MEISFTGSRKGMTKRQRTALTILLEEISNHEEATRFHHGGAIGADTEADHIARYGGLAMYVHPASEDKYLLWSNFCGPNVFSPKSPLERNQDIASICHMLIAAPQTLQEELRSGTWAIIRYARKRGKPVVILDP